MSGWAFDPPEHEVTRAHVTWESDDQSVAQVTVCDVAVACSCRVERVKHGRAVWSFVTDLQTRRNRQRQGLATRLLRRLAEAHTLCLFAERNAPAHKLYRRLGFRERSDVPTALVRRRGGGADAFLVLARRAHLQLPVPHPGAGQVDHSHDQLGQDA